MRDYAQYLLSDDWQERRRLVLQRTNGFCEGCQSRRATQVHHLTYAHAGAEFLWELVAICDACHARVHDKPAKPRARVAFAEIWAEPFKEGGA